MIDIAPANNKLLVSYKLWFTELLVSVSLMAGVAAFVIFAIGSADQNFSILAKIWLWLFGGNFILTILRFHNFVRSAIDNA